MLGLTVISIIAVNSEVFNYDGDVPFLPFSFNTNLTDPKNASVKIDQEITFFLSSKCSKAGTCTTSDHDGVLETQEKQIVPKSEFIVPINGQRLFGKGFKGPLSTPFSSDSDSIINVVSNSSQPIDLVHDGVLAFGFRESVAKSDLAKKIFQDLEKKQIIFRRGPFKQTLRDKQMTDTRGVIATGVNNIDGCGEFEYKKTEPYRGWTVKADVTIGEQSYPNSYVTFSLDQPTVLHGAAFWQYNNKSEESLPEIVLYYDSQNRYTLKKENLQQFEGPKHDQFKLFLKTQIDLQFVMGSNFLSDYCIALRTNDDMTKAEIGLAPIIKLEGDPQWKSY